LGSGWHLPSREEWQELVRAVDPNAQLTSGGSDNNDVAGTKLKSTTGWYYDYGTDDYGFSALPGGCRITDGSFNYAGSYGDWWTATEGWSGNAYGRFTYYDDDSVHEGYIDKNYGFSVRCVSDN
jgi:uncharacterized protein (TIGR02145 family)